jgi:hypothetical protein
VSGLGHRVGAARGDGPTTGDTTGPGPAVPLIGMAGGYALSGRGPRWARALSGAVALAPVAGWVVAAQLISSTLAVGTPRGAWVAVHFASSLAVLSIACAIPHRPAVAGAVAG